MLVERQTNISPLSYLAELLKHTTSHVTDGDDAVTICVLDEDISHPFFALSHPEKSRFQLKRKDCL
jgi:hypothetical protein